MQDYCDCDKDLRRPYFHRLPSRLAPVDDRPLSSPFVMAPAPTSSLSTSLLPSSHMNGSGVGSSASSPKGQAIWADESSYRLLPAGYMGGLTSHEVHRSPIQAHRYTPAPSNRSLPPASSIHRMVSPPPTNRARPPPSPFSHPSGIHRSPPTRYYILFMCAAKKKTNKHIKP